MKKSLKDLALEMIRSHKEYTYPRIQSKKNVETYCNTMDFIHSLLNRPWEFQDLQSQMYWFNSYSELLKKDDKYFRLAVEQCLDIVESLNNRFIDPYDLFEC